MNIIEFHNTVSSYIEETGMFNSSDNILVGLSGGPDSVALIHVLISLGYKCTAAHCNFHLRGSESDRDMNFVRDLCKSLDVDVLMVDFDTVDYAKSHKLSIEMAARELRYNWFGKLINENGFEKISIAHHSDDAIETFFINLSRGAGIHGLTGIRPINGNIVRPLLCVSRKDIMCYLEQCGLEYVIDSTNQESDYLRNKFRNIIIPAIESSVGGFKFNMVRNLSIIQKTENYLNEKIEQDISCYRSVKENGTVTFDIEKLKCDMGRNASFLLGEFLKTYGFGHDSIDKVLNMSKSDSGQKFLSKDYSLYKNRGLIEICQNVNNEDAENPYYIIDKQTSEIDTPIHLRIIENADTGAKVFSSDIACLDAEKLKFPLVLRHWKNGDFFYPSGMVGKKKISDYFVNRKLSVNEKNSSWLLLSDEKIVWVVGMRVDNRFIATRNTKNTITIELI